MYFQGMMMEESLDDNNSKEPVGWKLCIFYQESNTSKGAVVLNPRTESYQKLLDMVTERACEHDGQFFAIQRCLQGCTKEMLLDKETTWHQSCYFSATNQTELQRARDRFEHSMSSGRYAVKKKRGYKRSSSEMEADTPRT